VGVGISGAFVVHSSERLRFSQPFRFILPKLQGNYGNAPFEAGPISLYFLSTPPKQSLPHLLSSASQQSLGSGVSSGHSNILLKSFNKYMLKKIDFEGFWEGSVK